MKKYFWLLTFGSFAVAAALGATGYFVPAGYPQDRDCQLFCVSGRVIGSALALRTP